MTNSTRKWIRAGLETLIHGLTSAIIATFTAMMIDHKDWGMFTPNFWKMAVANFSVSGGLRFFQWWNNNPLPPEGDTVTIIAGNPPIVQTPTISLNPLAKVQSVPIPVAPSEPPASDPLSRAP